MVNVGENNACILPTLEGWVYIIPIHGPLDGPLYTWAQYTPIFFHNIMDKHSQTGGNIFLVVPTKFFLQPYFI